MVAKLYIYIYIFSKAHSQRCFKHKIDIQRKTLLVNVSAKAFISNDCSCNQTEHTYQFKNLQTIPKQ